MTRPEPHPRSSAVAILLAAGRSERMRGDAGAPDAAAPIEERKPFLVLEGRTILEHACDAFRRAARVSEIVLVVHAEDLERARALAPRSAAMAKVAVVVAGGEARTLSVRRGVAAAREDAELFAIHDVARPLVEPERIDAAIQVAARRGAALLAAPVTDTIKTSADGRLAERTLDRAVLWCAQTPQVFGAARFRGLLEQAAREGYLPTDDAALHERYAGPVPIVEGSPDNIKITTRADLVVAAAILRARRERTSPGR